MFLQVEDVVKELNKDTFLSWEVVKCVITTRFYDILIDPSYYEYDKLEYIKLGDLYYNRSCHLEEIEEHKFKAQINIAADIDTAYYYPINIITNYLQAPYISLDIKLRYPHDLKSVFDNENHYDDFYVDFYKKQNINNIYISCTERDNLIKDDITVGPMQKWYAYVYNIVKGEAYASD